MHRIIHTYALRRFADSSDPDFLTAIGIYVNSIPPDVRTNSNEITHWLDRSYNDFGDDFIICGFYSDKRVIGFVQMALLRQQRVLFFDYLLLHQQHRTEGEYFQLARMLQEWIDAETLEFDYAVAEVSYETATSQPSKRSQLLVELFKQIGFGCVQAEYYQPPLGLNNPQSDIRAHLLVASKGRLRSLKRETVIHIVRAVYFQHYERWFTPFLPKIEAYHAFLEMRLRDLERNLGAQQDVVVNGIRHLHPPVITSPAPRAAPRPALWTPLLVIAAFGIVCATFISIQARARLEWQTVALLFAGTLLVFASAFALFNRNMERVLRALLSVLTSFFGTRK